MTTDHEEDRVSIGRQISFWMRHERIDRVQELADARGISRNAMMSVLVDEYEPA